MPEELAQDLREMVDASGADEDDGASSQKDDHHEESNLRSGTTRCRISNGARYAWDGDPRQAGTGRQGERTGRG